MLIQQLEERRTQEAGPNAKPLTMDALGKLLAKERKERVKKTEETDDDGVAAEDSRPGKRAKAYGSRRSVSSKVEPPLASTSRSSK